MTWALLYAGNRIEGLSDERMTQLRTLVQSIGDGTTWANFSDGHGRSHSVLIQRGIPIHFVRERD